MALYGAQKVLDVKLNGMDKLYAELRKFPEDVQRKVVKQATLAGAVYIRDAIVTAAPVRMDPSTPMRESKKSGRWRFPGFLKRQIKVWINKRPFKAATLTYSIGFTKKAFYGRFSEFGFTLRNGVKKGARPWFRPAQERASAQAIDMTVYKTKQLIGAFMRYYAALKWVG